MCWLTNDIEKIINYDFDDDIDDFEKNYIQTNNYNDTKFKIEKKIEKKSKKNRKKMMSKTMKTWMWWKNRKFQMLLRWWVWLWTIMTWNDQCVISLRYFFAWSIINELVKQCKIIKKMSEYVFSLCMSNSRKIKKINEYVISLLDEYESSN